MPRENLLDSLDSHSITPRKGRLKPDAMAETPPPTRLRFFLYNQTNRSELGTARLAGSITRYRTDELSNCLGSRPKWQKSEERKWLLEM
jgi:hypothetical protein